VPFAEAHATSLTAARLAALGDRVDADLAIGRHVELVAELESLVAEHPYQERFWAQLMLALYRSGSQSDALRCCSRLRRMLAEEMGIVPSPVVAALEQAILRQDPDLDRSTADPGPGPAASVERGAAGDADPSDLSWFAHDATATFVGRRRELRIARRARAVVAGGEQLLLLVTGEPGIGKTRLTAEVARQADADGDLVLHGRWDEEVLCPYQAFREALGRYVQRAPEVLVRADTGPDVEVLGKIVPELLDRLAVVEKAARVEPEGERYRVFEAVHRWLGRVAGRRRLVLVLDDLHWADPPSLRLLEYVLRATPPVPALIVATYRQTDAGVTEWLAQSLVGMRRTAEVERIPLAGLSAAEAQELLEAAVGRTLSEQESHGAVNLRDHTGGNPFFLQEVVRDLDEAGDALEAWAAAAPDALPVPERLRDVVHWRLRELSPACMKLLGTASAMGEEFDTAIVGAALGCDDDELLRLVDEARLAGVIFQSYDRPDGHRFAHAVVRQALYDDLGAARRVRLHRRLGTTLQGRYGPEAPHHAAELARHFYLGADAGGVEEALGFLRLAADAAVRHVAYEAAVEHLTRALELVARHLPSQDLLRCEFLLDMAKACVKAGRLADANDRFLDAFALARVGNRTDLLAEAALGFGGVLPAGAEPDAQARALLETALDQLGPHDSKARALALGRLAQWGHYDLPLDERRRLADDAVDVARRLGSPTTLAAVLAYRYWALSGPDDIDRQVAAAGEIRRLGELVGDREIVLHGLKCELHSRFELGDFAGSQRVAEALGQVAREIQQPEYLRLVCMWDSLVAGIEGRFEDAESRAEEVFAIFDRAGHSQAVAIQFGLALPWRWLQGRMKELRILLELGRTGRASLGETAMMAWVASEIDEPDTARALLRSLRPDEVTDGERNFPWWFVMAGLTQTSYNLADTRWAPILYDMVLPFADHNCRAGQATFLGAARLHLGMLAGLLGRHDEAVGHLEEAVARHLSMRARPFTALTQSVLADALAARGRPEDVPRARELRADAEATSAALGVPRAVARVAP